MPNPIGAQAPIKRRKAIIKDTPFRLVMTAGEKEMLSEISRHYGVTQSEAVRQMVQSAHKLIGRQKKAPD